MRQIDIWGVDVVGRQALLIHTGTVCAAFWQDWGHCWGEASFKNREREPKKYESYRFNYSGVENCRPDYSLSLVRPLRRSGGVYLHRGRWGAEKPSVSSLLRPPRLASLCFFQNRLAPSGLQARAIQREEEMKEWPIYDVRSMTPGMYERANREDEERVATYTWYTMHI